MIRCILAEIEPQIAYDFILHATFVKNVCRNHQIEGPGEETRKQKPWIHIFYNGQIEIT